MHSIRVSINMNYKKTFCMYVCIIVCVVCVLGQEKACVCAISLTTTRRFCGLDLDIILMSSCLVVLPRHLASEIYLLWLV